MNRKLARDLQAWESGQMSADEIVARHPSNAEQVRRLTGLFTEMRSLADTPVPDATRGWNEVRSRMAAHVARQPVSVLERFSPRLQRRLAIGMAAALLVVPPVALAAADEQVREGVTNFVLGDIDLSFSIFGNDGQSAAGQSGEPLEVEVGDGGSSVPVPAAPKAPESKSDPVGTDVGSSTALSGEDGGNVSSGSNGAGQVSGSAATDGAAGTNGEAGEPGPDGEGSDGESGKGSDAKGADASPSPSPTPTEGTSGSGASADTPSAP